METTGLRLTETEAAYFAGFIDGEGSLGHYADTPRVAVSNTYLPVMKELQAAFGGTWHLRDAKTDRSRTCYAWVAYGDNARQCCLALLPFLREKRRQAQILLDLGHFPKGSAQREALLSELNTLKRVDHE